MSLLLYKKQAAVPLDRTLIRNKIEYDSIKCRRSRSPQKVQMGARICTRKISSKNNVLEIREKADNAPTPT
ncbi:hypothetical protein QUA43_08505 [Microcoleus sp. N9_B4]|uniref:hypothetical protein n=1 Tax=Microcoleus sp. N9_B4 TaxID=3055386 RepID=UPI002FD79472